MMIELDNLPKGVSEALTRRAKEQGRSVQEVALEALALGLEGSVVQRDLSDIAGTWVEDPAFDEAVAEFDRVDPEQWK